MKAFIVIVCACSITNSLWGQGTITGHVREANADETLTGASIRLSDLSIGAVADSHGNFSFHNVAVGTHSVEVSFVGYAPFSETIEVKDKQITSLDIGMHPGEIQLADVTIVSNDQHALNTLSPLDIKLRPTNTSQDILRMVPGLFIAQHAGGGKAEQIFLRGFDIDHGTDVNLEVDGLPVNMVSHAHGQGYADLHFIIPEVIHSVDFNKGPYFADKGDFTTAGYVDFQTKNHLDNNFIKLEGGQFGTMRGVVGMNFRDPKTSKVSGYIASEFFRTNGYVESPQDFNRFNVMSKFTVRFTDKDRLIVGATFFKSGWDASGQVPQRAVTQGLITRLGSIDNTEGGNTLRANLSLKHIHEFRSGSYFTQQAYAVRYDFNLYSNFTFFLHDQINGDQINQRESRMIYGYKALYTSSNQIFGKSLITEFGAGLRLDNVNDIRLSHTVRRAFIGNVKRGTVDQMNINGHYSGTITLTDKWSMVAGARFDYFNFRYVDRLNGTDRSVGKAIVSPKLMINYQVNPKAQLYLRSGYGFHSNDTRVVTAEMGKEILPKALGFDLGLDSKITDKLLLNLALWRLDLQQEFVYVGDEGVVEPSGKTVREGIDFSLRYQLASWLFLDSDVNLTRPKAKGAPLGETYIPLAPTFSSIGGISFRMKNGFNGSVRYRYLGDRPANEDNSVTARGYFLSDAILNFTRKAFEVGISAENIFNVQWNEAQFETESRLKDESIPVSEIHFTPGTPVFMKLRLCFFI
ncbi:MAG TPA: TonB-dependent receptor [Chryseolinea sp.]|nr:TonB-dependent receptor [Chryseolinea sp.]